MSTTQQTTRSEVPKVNGVILRDSSDIDDNPTRMELKASFVKAAFLNAALPLMRDIGELFAMRGEEIMNIETPSYQYLVSRDFNYNLNVELRMKDGGKCLWQLKGTNGHYQALWPNPELNREVVNRHIVGFNSQGAPIKKGKKPTFYGQHHWFQRLVLLHTRLSIEGFEMGHSIDRMKGLS